MSEVVQPWQLRASFAQRLSTLYGTEVPAYNMLLEVSGEVNANVLRQQGAEAERLGSIDRVTAERHGAIRVGTPQELAEVARIFGALGMYPTGFYDLRDAVPAPIPVVSTAFRPVDSVELARNPFRVFTSMLVPEDRRFFSPGLGKRLSRFLAARTLFPDELLALADHAEAEQGLPQADAERFLELAVQAFALSREPVDRIWYSELEAVSSVAADIGGVTTTHINHLTPRVLDIDDLYQRMSDRGITMIDRIQGPPRWRGADILLRQTSFRALAESRRFREPDGAVVEGSLRVRFGEVEARGLAPTPVGRDKYEAMILETDRRAVSDPERSRAEHMAQVWREQFPTTELDLAQQDLAYFTFRINDARPRDGQPPTSLATLLSESWIIAEPIVYEDFLPRSAAGIFSSNLTSQGEVDTSAGEAPRDRAWMSGAIARDIADPSDLYAAQRDASLEQIQREFGLQKIN
ncbi:VOC family protein [Saccharopolyspora spinosa]|uniref:2-oxoadipate dioxygenase/decarboxylase n=1 Tax=Saccharopolyspora spinosa TaxID=60894 RepID=A0A2N3Y1E3_SACSN|nr:VOC family protein [Saccharopolyspora spinosa]PKW16681.1 putative glyoxalase superfamily metalloenzyme YdcJ [Saccharopolyspora spinosa]